MGKICQKYVINYQSMGKNMKKCAKNMRKYEKYEKNSKIWKITEKYEKLILWSKAKWDHFHPNPKVHKAFFFHSQE